MQVLGLTCDARQRLDDVMSEHAHLGRRRVVHRDVKRGRECDDRGDLQTGFWSFGVAIILRRSGWLSGIP